jgi:hypothetical protein
MIGDPEFAVVALHLRSSAETPVFRPGRSACFHLRTVYII